jgi:hypothetical protein
MEMSISAISDGNRSSTLSALLLGKEVAMEELGAGSLEEGIKEGESRNDGDGGEREMQQEVIQQSEEEYHNSNEKEAGATVITN